MLIQLSIRDIVLIDRLDIDLTDRLTVLTGETGAGKSIVLDAFALALGARGDATLVRTGAEQGSVTAAFEVKPSHPARALLAADGLDSDGDLILRRVQLADGRTRAFVNDQPVSVQVLRELGVRLVEIHGQHDERAMVDPATHRALLDAFAGLSGRVAEVRGLWASWRDAEAAEAVERGRLQRALNDSDYVRHAVQELSTLSPQPGEEQVLADRRAMLMRAEKIAGDLKEAHDALAGPAAPGPTLAAALRRLERRNAEAGDLVGGPIKALDRALEALEEARAGLEAALTLAEFDPQELERIEERLFALRAAARKYSSTVDALPDVAARFTADLDAIDRGEERLKALTAIRKLAGEGYRAGAEALSAARKQGAAKLSRAVNKELKPLKLERAEFLTEIGRADAGPEGIDRVEFWVRTNPGAAPGPMMKVASGGELSRFLLALKVALADKGSASTLVFDEVDSSVGGAVSDAIGARLTRLGERVQVLAVTHAPQVAARAAQHFLVEKAPIERGKRVVTQARGLSAQERREEIARMLAGAEVTDEARRAAERLLKGAA